MAELREHAAEQAALFNVGTEAIRGWLRLVPEYLLAQFVFFCCAHSEKPTVRRCLV
jgi:hypothetical protein